MIYHFGAFALDSVRRRLTRDGAAVTIADRHVDVLLRLLVHPQEVVPKESLVQAAWPDVAVTDNSLEQAMSMLRKSGIAIDTVPRRGYRLAHDVRREASRHSDAEIDALLAPHRAWLEGRAALETLSAHNVGSAARAFGSVLDASPDHGAAHVGLANALVFRFEATRVDEQPDIDALAAAMPHAREACRLDPASGEAWATLGFVLHRTGDAVAGIAALRRAVDLEPDNWRHHLRLSFISWGEARLGAARHTLRLMPGLALAHWLSASVHVARQAFDAAGRELAAGRAAQDQQVEGAMFGGVGLHWLSGLLRLQAGDPQEAHRDFDRELAFEDSGHLYARECCAATWYAKGASALHLGDRAAASAAFGEVLRRVPRHPFALAASVAEGSDDDALTERLRIATDRGANVDVAVALSIRQATRGQVPDTAAVLAALQHAPPGPSAWYLPVEPMLRPDRDDRWAPALATVRSRAS